MRKSIHSYLVSLIIILGLLFYALIVAQKIPKGWGAMQYPQLVMGNDCHFVYVGMEVTVQKVIWELCSASPIEDWMPKFISQFISLYWGSLGDWSMDRRCFVFNLKKSTKNILTIVVPIGWKAFCIILLVNHLFGNDVTNLYIYILCCFFLIAAFFNANEKPARMGLLWQPLKYRYDNRIIDKRTSKYVCVFISSGLCCSVMWPYISLLPLQVLENIPARGHFWSWWSWVEPSFLPLKGVICDFDKMSPGYCRNELYSFQLHRTAYLFCLHGLACQCTRVKYSKHRVWTSDQQVSGGHWSRSGCDIIQLLKQEIIPLQLLKIPVHIFSPE